MKNRKKQEDLRLVKFLDEDGNPASFWSRPLHYTVGLLVLWFLIGVILLAFLVAVLIACGLFTLPYVHAPVAVTYYK